MPVCRDCGVKLVEAEVAINDELCFYCLQLDDRESFEGGVSV